MLHLDPMLEFYKTLCQDDITAILGVPHTGRDPMLLEASTMCGDMVRRPLSFAPPPVPQELQEVSNLWGTVADLNEEAAALGYDNVVHFGPAA